MRSKFPITLVAVCAVALVSVLLADIGGHVIYRLQHGQWLFSENEHFRVGFVEKVPQRRVYKLKAGFRDDLYTVGQDSCRVVPGCDKDASREFLCFLGDSVPFGSGVKDDQTYPFFVQRLLDQNNSDVGVVNAGTPSYNLRQAFDRYRLDIKPNYDCKVVFFQSVNDISLVTQLGRQWSIDSTWAQSKWKNRRYFSSLVFMLFANRGQVDLKPYRNMDFINSIKHMLGVEYEKCGLQDKTVVFLSLNPFYYSDLENKLNSKLPDFARLENYIKAWNANVDAFNAVLEDFASNRKNVYFIPVNKIFDSSEMRREYFIDFLHLSPEGNKFLAEKIFDFLKSAKLI